MDANGAGKRGTEIHRRRERQTNYGQTKADPEMRDFGDLPAENVPVQP